MKQEEQDRLTRVDAGSLMGEFFRQYWIPIIQSDELVAGRQVKRVRVLGEDLVAYRSPDNSVGLIAEACAHRCASLFYARNELGGLRCVYHGWKYDSNGRCTDMPNEPAESSFKNNMRTVAYPCEEKGGVVWAYMGDEASRTVQIPKFEWLTVPEENRFISKYYEDCNYLQAMEGGIDSSHIGFLHAPLSSSDQATIGELDRSGFGIADAVDVGDRAPHIEVVSTDYGAMIGARRRKAHQDYWRVTQFLLPFYTMPPTDTADPVYQSHAWVPSDDNHLVNWCIMWNPNRALTPDEISDVKSGMGTHVLNYGPSMAGPYGDIRTLANRENDHLIDWDTHYTKRFFGVMGFGLQDKAVVESQGFIHKRTMEHLGTADLAIVKIRRMLINCATAVARGDGAPAQDGSLFYIRPASLRLAKELSWVEAVAPMVTISSKDTEISEQELTKAK